MLADRDDRPGVERRHRRDAQIAALAETYGVPLVLHNVAGPICHAACMHLGAHIPNLYFVESVRAFYKTYFPILSDMVTMVTRAIWPCRMDRALASPCAPLRWHGRTSRARSPRVRGWPHRAMGDHWAVEEIR